MTDRPRLGGVWRFDAEEVARALDECHHAVLDGFLRRCAAPPAPPSHLQPPAVSGQPPTSNVLAATV